MAHAELFLTDIPFLRLTCTRNLWSTLLEHPKLWISLQTPSTEDWGILWSSPRGLARAELYIVSRQGQRFRCSTSTSKLTDTQYHTVDAFLLDGQVLSVRGYQVDTVAWKLTLMPYLKTAPRPNFVGWSFGFGSCRWRYRWIFALLTQFTPKEHSGEPYVEILYTILSWPFY